MKIIEKYELAAKEKKSIKIGIGLGDSKNQNQKILTASLNFLKKFKSTIWFFGKKDSMKSIIIQTPNNEIKSNVKFIDCEIPEKTIVDFLIRNSIDSIVRGSLSSNKFLDNLKKINIQIINFIPVSKITKNPIMFNKICRILPFITRVLISYFIDSFL